MLKPNTKALKRGCDQRENGLIIGKHEFPYDRGYFKFHLVLEHYVLRRMDTRERYVMSKIEPDRGMKTAWNEG